MATVTEDRKKFTMPGLGLLCPVCGGPMHVGRTVQAPGKIIRYRYCNQRCQGGRGVAIERFVGPDSTNGTKPK